MNNLCKVCFTGMRFIPKGAGSEASLYTLKASGYLAMNKERKWPEEILGKVLD